jgi:hypothetical protein
VRITAIKKKQLFFPAREGKSQLKKIFKVFIFPCLTVPVRQGLSKNLFRNKNSIPDWILDANPYTSLLQAPHPQLWRHSCVNNTIVSFLPIN